MEVIDLRTGIWGAFPSKRRRILPMLDMLASRSPRGAIPHPESLCTKLGTRSYYLYNVWFLILRGGERDDLPHSVIQGNRGSESLANSRQAVITKVAVYSALAQPGTVLSAVILATSLGRW